MLSHLNHKPLALRGKVILIVEREVPIALDLQAMLNEMDVSTALSAATVSDALEVVQRRQVDAAVLDAGLAGEPALPVAEKLEELGSPFVLTTACTAALVPKRWLHRVVLKPYDPEDLINLLCRLIEARLRVASGEGRNVSSSGRRQNAKQ